MKRAKILCLCLAVLTGCGRIVFIDYEAANPFKGQGEINIVPFRYEPNDAHRVRPRQVEIHPNAKTELYLAQEIGAFFTEALRKELRRSGYTVDSGKRAVLGTVTQFYLDWTSGVDRSFLLGADYEVRHGPQTMFTWRCSSLQQGPNQLAEDSALIRKGVMDCMQRFLESAQAAHAL